jgi:hypothetical protein
LFRFAFVKIGFILLCDSKKNKRASDPQVMKKTSGKTKSAGTAKTTAVKKKAAPAKPKAPVKNAATPKSKPLDDDPDEFLEEENLDFDSFDNNAGSYDDDEDDDF